MESFDITAIVNGHREGLLAQPSLLSLRQTIEESERRGIRVETVIVLDRPDTVTQELVESFSHSTKNTRVVTVDHGDLGLSRNSGVDAAQGKWIAFLDADDLWGRTWLSAAFNAAESDPRPIVWHPELSVLFGSHPHLYLHIDMEDPEFDHAALAVTNYWTALCFAPRSLLQHVPYRHTRMSSQIGFEDWGWNMETIAQGWLHKIVPGTGHAVRRKETSLLQQTKSASCLPHASNLFRQLLERRATARSAKLLRT
jgi:glycosyltransferase involved in cell wall biosynthesis